MGWSFGDANWAGVEGAMYMGEGTMTAVYTAIAAVVCVAVLWKGNRDEHKKYDSLK